jgi:muramoyltetrapeptide carboxypeptidase
LNAVFPPKLQAGDEIRVLALSRSLGAVTQPGGFTAEDIRFGVERLESLGLKVSFGCHANECNAHLTASIQHRLEDFHEALASPSVKAILAVTGGIGAIQLLDELDYGGIRASPKILCGYSDIAYLCNALYARSGLVTYYGPNFTSFLMRQGFEHTLAGFRACLFERGPLLLTAADQWSDNPWHKDQERRTFRSNEGFWPIQAGEAEGTILGGSYWSLNMLQGSPYFPPLQDAILFLEHPPEGKATLMALDSALRALSFQPGFEKVRGVVLGRFAESCGVRRENLADLIDAIPALGRMPVLANCDFGHTTPIFTFPVGGRCVLKVGRREGSITLTAH